jgi:hypothetical protein
MAAPPESTCSAVRRADPRSSATRGGCDSFAFTSGPLPPLSRLEALGSVLVAKNPGQPRANARPPLFSASIQLERKTKERFGKQHRESSRLVLRGAQTRSHGGRFVQGLRRRRARRSARIKSLGDRAGWISIDDVSHEYSVDIFRHPNIFCRARMHRDI